MAKVMLYYNTVKNMKFSQVFNRVRIKLGKGCTLGTTPKADIGSIQIVESPADLDFDPVFLSRFPVEELMENKITILHSSKNMDWTTSWSFDDKSALWNFNLHYFEYLFPLIKSWKDTGDDVYLNKSVEIINSWIDANKPGNTPGWCSYPTALRIISWISWYSYASEAISEDFRYKFLNSLHKQFVYLANHLEKDILGNHYFEDLKSLVIASLFFKDDAVFNKVLKDFKAECKEEILPDGMHFELSPMYHKIIFEGILRIVVALRGVGINDHEIEFYIQSMLDVAYSFESGLERVPLFNDGGNNVAKSLDALVIVAVSLGYVPHFKAQLKNSGFYIFQKIVSGKEWKLIVDAGQPGPKYNPGHAHCDAMSYELFCNGKPISVNCGTFSYQCKERDFFRSTQAHNTVMIEGTDQSQCWGAFRLAKRSSVKVIDVSDNSIVMELKDSNGKMCIRKITIDENSVVVSDKSTDLRLDVFVHIATPVNIDTSVVKEEIVQPYAPDYGVKQDIICYRLSNIGEIVHSIQLGSVMFGT